jgi:hypothetical protein
VDSASSDKITVNKTPLAPTGLQADAVNSSGLKTRLTWTANTDAGVIGYNIYAKFEDEPYLAQIGSSATNSFNTGDDWAENASVVTSIYAVSAKKGDGTESFLSNMVENNDRDHDGLTDEQEMALGTNVNNPDSDGDGLKDGEEYVRGTNPLLADTDGDGFSDFAEVQAGSDPLDANSVSQHTLAVTKSGTGTGTVSSNPSGINCGPTCSANFTQGATVTLTATPDAGSTFAGWSGGVCSGTGTCVVTMNAATTVTATFTQFTNCAATVSPDFTVHVPIGIYNGQHYSADFQWDGNVSLILTNLVLLNDTSAFSNCTPASVSTDMVLHVPVAIYSGVSYWAEVQCNLEGLPFTITGVGQN